MSILGLIFVLAHQSDWKSLGLVLIPLSFFVWILAVAKRRVDRDGPVTLGKPSIDRERPPHI